MASTNPTHAPPDNSSHRTINALRENIAAASRHTAVGIIRLAAACMAGWSLYTVARHYDVPRGLALAAGLVFDGVAYLCLRSASDAIRAGRTAAPSILATLGMASVSVYLNLVHADITHGGHPAEVLYASPALGLLIVSALSWNADRASARAARGESAFRLPSFGFWGWLLAPEEAAGGVRQRAVTHVTSGASPAHQPASRPRTAHAVLAEKFAAMDPAQVIEVAAEAHPHLSHNELAELLGSYGCTMSALDVALVLELAATPTITLDRVPPTAAPLAPKTGQPALGNLMRGDAPQLGGLSTADAITTMARHLGGLATAPAAVAQALAQAGRPTDTAYVRTALSRARKAEEKAAEEAATEVADQQAAFERRHGNGGYA